MESSTSPGTSGFASVRLGDEFVVRSAVDEGVVADVAQPKQMRSLACAAEAGAIVERGEVGNRRPAELIGERRLLRLQRDGGRQPALVRHRVGCEERSGGEVALATRRGVRLRVGLTARAMKGLIRQRGLVDEIAEARRESVHLRRYGRHPKGCKRAEPDPLQYAGFDQQELLVARLVQAQRYPHGRGGRKPAHDEGVAVDWMPPRVRRDVCGAHGGELVQHHVVGLHTPALADLRRRPVLFRQLQVQLPDVRLPVDRRLRCPSVEGESAQGIAHPPPLKDAPTQVTDRQTTEAGSEGHRRRTGEECRRPAGGGPKQIGRDGIN